jgi:hypothetical protein
MPEPMNRVSERRKNPSDSDGSGNLMEDVDMSVKHFCKRAMMQEPHCLNTSILDCSVTFTVDKDMCIQGIEVPSQARIIKEISDIPVKCRLISKMYFWLYKGLSTS